MCGEQMPAVWGWVAKKTNTRAAIFLPVPICHLLTISITLSSAYSLLMGIMNAMILIVMIVMVMITQILPCDDMLYSGFLFQLKIKYSLWIQDKKSAKKYFHAWSQIEMSFTSVVNIWDNVSGSTPLPPHKTYKCLRNFPAGLYTHARWHLFKKKTWRIFSQNFVEFDW